MSFTTEESPYSFLRFLFFFFFFNETEISLMPERHILGWYILFALTWMYPTLLVHSSIEGYPDLFKFLPIMNSAAVHNFILV